ncbi:MAG: thioredoxin family protein [Thermoguttaceae bacterium]|nr:thioredoxin family protein [Thermoguttaceae bacterium]
MQPTHSRSARSVPPGFAFVVICAIAAGGIFSGCQRSAEPDPAAEAAPGQAVVSPSSAPAIPRLVDLGAGKCIPCKMMAPILDELKEEYAGSLDVVFIDVWEDASAGEKYGIETIPTQIFYDPDGKELFRHVGFIAKEEILAKWEELGFPLEKTSADSPSADAADAAG